MKSLLKNTNRKFFSTCKYEAAFLPVSLNNPFPIQNIPFGVFQQKGEQSQNKICVALGENLVDVHSLVNQGILSKLPEHVQKTLLQPTLNSFFSLKRSERAQVRETLQYVLREGTEFEKQLTQNVHNQQEVEMQLPIQVGDYTDFYASRKHAENVGEMFRGPDNKLMPNWLHMPIAYHGRASSVNVKKTLKRPKGQVDLGKFGNEGSLDIELEMAMIVGGESNQNQTSIPIQQAYEHIGGFSLMNDWSARQIQRVEYVPLGPFLGKNFSTTLSPWVLLPEAIEQFRFQINNQDGILEYLQSNDLNLYDIPLQVLLKTSSQSEYNLISESNMSNLHWTFEQMIAHHTVNGCNFNAGDLLGSGTISGEDASKNGGSMLELSWNRKNPIQVGNETRCFLEDGDTVVLRGGRRLENGQFVGFGDVETKILPADN